MGSDNHKPRRRGFLSRAIVIPCCSLFIMLIGFFVVNFKFMAVDLSIAERVKSYHQESKPQVPVFQNALHPMTPRSSMANQQLPAKIEQEETIEEMKHVVEEKVVEKETNQEDTSGKYSSRVSVDEHHSQNVFEENHSQRVNDKDLSQIGMEEGHSQVNMEADHSQVGLANNPSQNLYSNNLSTINHTLEDSSLAQANPSLSKEAVIEEQSNDSEQFHLRKEGTHRMIHNQVEEEREITCADTPLSEALKNSHLFHLSDFDCSTSNQGWRDHIPPPLTNSTRSEKEWKKRIALIEEFGKKQDHYDFDDTHGKYIIFWPIFAGIGNNLAIFSEVLLIAFLSNRKFLIYDWDSLRDYLYLPFQYEVITEKVWERDLNNTLIVEKTNQCPFNTVDLAHGKVDARFVVFRSTCLTAQQLVKNKPDKKWFAERGIVSRTLLSPQETLHHIYRWLYAEVMTPRPMILDRINEYKLQFDWDHKYMVGVHIRTGGVNKERIRWGRFLNEKDIQMFKKYSKMLLTNYEKGILTGYIEKKLIDGEMKAIGQEKFDRHYPLNFYVLSDQDGVKENILDDLGEKAVTTRCDMTHTNKARKQKDDPGFICALIENYLLSSSDFLILTTRSTYGYLARHRTNSPYVTIDIGCYDNWKKLSQSDKSKIPVEYWSVNYL